MGFFSWFRRASSLFFPAPRPMLPFKFGVGRGCCEGLGEGCYCGWTEGFGIFGEFDPLDPLTWPPPPAPCSLFAIPENTGKTLHGGGSLDNVLHSAFMYNCPIWFEYYCFWWNAYGCEFFYGNLQMCNCYWISVAAEGFQDEEENQKVRVTVGFFYVSGPILGCDSFRASDLLSRYDEMMDPIHSTRRIIVFTTVVNYPLSLETPLVLADAEMGGGTLTLSVRSNDPDDCANYNHPFSTALCGYIGGRCLGCLPTMVVLESQGIPMWGDGEWFCDHPVFPAGEYGLRHYHCLSDEELQVIFARIPAIGSFEYRKAMAQSSCEYVWWDDDWLVVFGLPHMNPIDGGGLLQIYCHATTGVWFWAISNWRLEIADPLQIVTWCCDFISINSGIELVRVTPDSECLDIDSFETC